MLEFLFFFPYFLEFFRSQGELECFWNVDGSVLILVLSTVWNWSQSAARGGHRFVPVPRWPKPLPQGDAGWYKWIPKCPNKCSISQVSVTLIISGLTEFCSLRVYNFLDPGAVHFQNLFLKQLLFLHPQVPEGSNSLEHQKKTELHVLPGIWLEILNGVGASWNTE